jgi:hypothetical protein
MSATPPQSISRTFGPAISKVKCVNLALQGGSAHGAFTWGVLIQGMAGGLLQLMVARVAGRQFARVFGYAAVPILLAPLAGPILAGTHHQELERCSSPASAAVPGGDL